MNTAIRGMLPKLLLIYPLTPILALEPAVQDPAEQAWFGAELQGTSLDSSAATLAGVPAGIHLLRVLPGGPCHRSGFATGDILLSVDGSPFGPDEASALGNFIARLGDARPGDRMSVSLLRVVTSFEGARDGEPDPDAAATARHLIELLDGLPPGASLEVRGSKHLEKMELEVTLGQRPTASGAALAPTEELFAGMGIEDSPFLKMAEEHMRDQQLLADHEDLLARLDRISRRGDPSRVVAMVLAHREPFQLPQLAAALSQGFERPDPAQGVGPALRALLEHADACENGAGLDERGAEGPGELAPGLAPEQLMDALEALLREVVSQCEVGIADLSPEELEHVRAHWTEVFDRFESHIYLYSDEDQGRAARNEETLRIGEKIRRPAFRRAALQALPLVAGDWLGSLQADLEAAGLDTSQPTVLVRETEFGRIRIAGTGDDFHRQGAQGQGFDASQLDAILIDLGGDDLHTGGATSVDPSGRPRLPLSVLVDLGGNDAFESTQDAAQGAGVLGVSILRDLEGDDVYTATRWAQAAGWMGVGILVDQSGADRYQSQSLAQGIGAWGIGILLDAGGADSYRAMRYGQGVGLAGGYGVLTDRSGGDDYYCKGRWPTSYGTPGVFDGWGQGCGVGFRGNASGGVGLLLDGAGEDRYEAGNFSQGGGYYFGLGVQIDRGTADDVYIGSRYNQGFSAHQAAGFFLEEGGDDLYETRNLVCQGLAWDESVTFFIDQGGDDRYRGGGFSLGASAHNAICIFHELSGDDVYISGAPGRSGGNDYHGGTSLSIFLEDGGGSDSYQGEDRNGKTFAQPEHGLMIDR